jgi:hypothetical protein
LNTYYILYTDTFSTMERLFFQEQSSFPICTTQRTSALFPDDSKFFLGFPSLRYIVPLNKGYILPCSPLPKGGGASAVRSPSPWVPREGESSLGSSLPFLVGLETEGYP